MRTVGVRELKAKLSEYLRSVRGGEVVLVTDRGRVVAELRAPGSARHLPPSLEGLRDLIERGVVSEGGPNDPALYRMSGISLPPEVVRRLLDEERGDR
ncbi:MAG: type II toxin-antitoxin system prevent-host-death family antitoxin [Planctomycetes bacterium]|nr:type II toxin-antitoxin system prevent-host-death family antitoxin [Planctomycetota bacterium]